MRKRIWIWWFILPSFLFLLATIWGEQVLLGQATNQLPAGVSASGEVTNRLGDEWFFHGCSGDVITVTMTSTEFPAYLELYGPTGRDSLISASADASNMPATIGSFTLADPESYTMVAAGVSIRDRGSYSLTLTISDTAEGSDSIDRALIDTGASITGTVLDRLGDEWFFRGCAQEEITITMQSDDFDPFLALYGPTGRDELEDTSGAYDANTTQINTFSLPQNGTYTIIAAGQSIRARGDYTLTIMVDAPVRPAATVTKVSTKRATSTTSPTVRSTATKASTRRATTTPRSTATKVSTRRATPTPSSTASPTASATATPIVRSCRVVSSSLNLRPGPGTNYEPVLGSLLTGAELVMQARDASNTWIQVSVAGSNQIGWVSAAEQYVNCTVNIATLPIGLIPPTPTALPTATPTFTPPPTATYVPTATPTFTPPPTATTPPQGPPRLDPVGIILQPPPGNPGGLVGDVYTTAHNYFFNDRFYFELYVYDPHAGNNVGDGIDRVEFEISCPNGGRYNRTEQAARYCSFSGGEPDCNVVRLRANENLPGSNCRVENGNYNIDITAFPHDRNRDRGNWNFDFTIDVGHSAGGGGNNQQQDLVASVAQIGPNNTSTTVSDSLVFQVATFAPNRGNRDGDGIRNVEMWIEGPDGRRVYSRTENNVAYCAFAGGEPNCNIFDLRNNSNWPDGGPRIESGPHRLRAIVHAEDGRRTEVSQGIEIVR